MTLVSIFGTRSPCSLARYLCCFQVRGILRSKSPVFECSLLEYHLAFMNWTIFSSNTFWRARRLSLVLEDLSETRMVAFGFGLYGNVFDLGNFGSVSSFGDGPSFCKSTPLWINTWTLNKHVKLWTRLLLENEGARTQILQYSFSISQK